jgi:glycerophosphoryl diester phosphodiesterase
MNTTKFVHPKKPLMVAHRGVSGLETENTHAAFVAAGNRSYYGIETDVHVTADGKYVAFHDDETGRLAAENVIIEQTDYAALRSMILRQRDGNFGRTDIRIPSLQEYIEICQKYEKVAVLELKNHFRKEQVFEICGIIDEIGYLENVIFISFDFENLIYVKEKHPNQTVQFLTGRCDEELAKKLSALGMDLDIYFEGFDRETAERCHRYGIKVNCWTVDRLADAARLADLGASFITSNILE